MNKHKIHHISFLLKIEKTLTVQFHLGSKNVRDFRSRTGYCFLAGVADEVGPGEGVISAFGGLPDTSVPSGQAIGLGLSTGSVDATEGGVIVEGGIGSFSTEAGTGSEQSRARNLKWSTWHFRRCPSVNFTQKLTAPAGDSNSPGTQDSPLLQFFTQTRSPVQNARSLAVTSC